MVYIGRAVGLGRTPNTSPAALYVVSGRSEESRARRATINDDVVHIGPLDGSDNDPLRHYDAVLLGEGNSIIVSNGTHTKSVRGVYGRKKVAGPAIRSALDVFGAEPDDYHTPRIAALFNFAQHYRGYFGIVNESKEPETWYRTLENGKAFFLPTYKGDDSNPRNIVVNDSKHTFPINLHGNTPGELAEELYGIMDKDFVVSTVAAVWDFNDQKWKFAVKNLHA